MFTPWDDVKVDGIFQATSVDQESRAGEACSTCNRRRNNRGVGSMFCHGCSGVDDKPLPSNVLHPVLQRKRLQLNMRDKKEKERLEQERLEQERKDQEREANE